MGPIYSNGQFLGTYFEMAGSIYLRLANGNVVGCYKPDWNKTFTLGGAVIGDGNLLAMLLR
jgi:hypothetical protein